MTQAITLSNFDLFSMLSNKKAKFSYNHQDDCLSICSNDSANDSIGSTSTQDSYQFAGYTKPSMSRKTEVYTLKRKTEICKTYSLGLVCPYGEKCSFAHGAHELRGKLLVPPRYKTVRCRDFHHEGFCQYGPRCQFIHKGLETNKPNVMSSFKYSQALRVLESASSVRSHECEPMETFLSFALDLPSYNLPRLPIFAELSFK